MRNVKMLLLAVLAMAWTQGTAQTIVKDAENNQPVIQASVYDDTTFEVIGVTGTDGQLPELGDAKRIRISHVAYQPQTIEVGQMADEVKMTPAVHKLNEVVKEQEKAYCLRLKCYHRHFMPNAHSKFGKKIGTDVPPLIDCYDELCDIFIFVDGKTPTMRMPAAARRLLGETFLPGPEAAPMKRLTMTSHSERREVRTNAQEKTAETFFDALAPEKEKKQNLFIFNYTISKDTEYALYSLADSDKPSTSGMLRYNTVKHLTGLTPMFPNTEIDAWICDEFFTYDAEFLTKDQYKAAEKELKKALKQPEATAAAAIDAKIKEMNVPALTDDIQQKIEASRQWWESQRKK